MILINGLCVSPGNAQGTVQIIREEQNSDSIVQKNTILVMRHLDRGLITKINKNVVGVIAEYGNIGSHGSGILRQLGIPCVLRIKNAETLFCNNDLVEILGNQNMIRCVHCKSFFQQDNRVDFFYQYQGASKPVSDLKDIRIINDWVSLRPKRQYQKLRFDMISDAFAYSPSFLFGTPKARTKQSETGSILVYGSPNTTDICSFIIHHPAWYEEKAKERTVVIDSIKDELRQLLTRTHNSSIENIQIVLHSSIRLYQNLFQYAFLSQFISDEMLQIYLDFLKNLLGFLYTKDIFALKSNYVYQNLLDGITLGDAQTWNRNYSEPHICQGSLDYSKLQLDPTVLNAINNNPENERLLCDYHAFRTIIPLLYQLSEEFFYISSSINSFINWALVNLHRLLIERQFIALSIEAFLELPLDRIQELLSDLLETP